MCRSTELKVAVEEAVGRTDAMPASPVADPKLQSQVAREKASTTTSRAQSTDSERREDSTQTAVSSRTSEMEGANIEGGQQPSSAPIVSSKDISSPSPATTPDNGWKDSDAPAISTSLDKPEEALSKPDEWRIPTSSGGSSRL